MKSPKPTTPKSNKTPNAQPQPELSPKQKLAKAQADADHWGAIAANPKLSPEAAAWAFNVARSARAEVALRQKGLQYQEAQLRPDPMLQSPLNLPSPTLSPQKPSDPKTPES
jgi:hypothetical protein